MQQKGKIQLSGKEFSDFLDGNCLETREKWREVSKDEIFRPIFNLSLRDQKELALKRLQKVAENKLFSVFDFLKNPLNVFANHEMAGYIDGSMATKMTVQLNLFGGTLVTLGTQRHLQVAEGIDSLSTIGCFALTELGFGNNAVQMETTAHYDAKTKEFVINSPTVLSQKYWITNGAYHCNYALVFAQLYMPGDKHEGVHVFLVRMRNEDGSVRPGIFIEDMGAKFGCNGVDNGRLKFTGVRVPRENLLNKFSDVSSEGVYSSSIEKKRERFLKVADRLLSGRLCIAAMMVSTTKYGLVTAVRFGNKRMAMGSSGQSDTPISEFGLFQNQVYPLLARTIILNTALNTMKELYSDQMLKTQQATPYLVCLCCAIKPLITWNCRDVGTTLVERVGGQGYLACNRVSELLPFAHSGITAEGDNSVLCQKVTKEVMLMISQGTFEFPKTSKQRTDLLKEKNLVEIDLLLDLVRFRENLLIQELQNTTQKKMEEGSSLYEVWMRQNNELVQNVAKAFGERVVAEMAHSRILSKSKGNTQNLLSIYLQLHLTSLVLKDLSWYLLNDLVSVPAAKTLNQNQKILIDKIHPNALNTVNSFGIPEHLITAPMAQDYAQFNDGPNGGEVYQPKL